MCGQAGPQGFFGLGARGIELQMVCQLGIREVVEKRFRRKKIQIALEVWGLIFLTLLHSDDRCDFDT